MKMMQEKIMSIKQYNSTELKQLVCDCLIEDFYMSKSNIGDVVVNLVGEVKQNSDNTESFSVQVISNGVEYDYRCLFDTIADNIIDVELEP